MFVVKIDKVKCPHCNNDNLYGHLGKIEEDDTIECNNCNEEINVIKNIKLEKDVI